MKQQLSQGTGNVCNLELTLIETKEQLEEKSQKVKELQSHLRDRENEIIFLREILAARTTLIHHQQNSMMALQQKIRELMEKEPPVVAMKSYVPEIEEELAEAAV